MEDNLLSHTLLTRIVATAALVSSPAIAVAQEYVVQPGDTLMAIANAELGSPARWRTICDLNADVVSDCDRILPGTVLRLSAAPMPNARPAPDPAPAATPEPTPEPAPAPVAEATPEPVPTVVNLLSNTGTDGAMPGVLGDGGALPAGWQISFYGAAEGTAEVVAVTDDHIDLRITQTSDGGAPALQFTPADSDYFPAEPGQTFRLSLELALIGGDLAGNGSPQMRGPERNEAGSSLGAVSFLNAVDLSSDLTRISGTATVDHPDARFINPDFRIASSGPWEATFRIGAPEFGVLSD
jgi:hypothetical protein